MNAAEVLGDRLAALAGDAQAADRLVRDGAPDGVHDLRVAARRVRSLLVTFRPLLAQPAAEALRAELRWVAGELGAQRDLEVVHARLTEVLAVERVEDVLGPVAARVADHARIHARGQVERVRATLAADRYTALVQALPPAARTLPIGQPSPEELARRLRRDWRRLRRRARAADAFGVDDRAREVALHEVRKAAKRARYAAETLAPVFGRDAERLAEAARAVQQALGDHRDTLLTRPVLRQLGVQAHLAGENGFTFGRWHALEQVRGAAALDAYAEARHALGRRGLRRWLVHPVPGPP